VECENVLYGPFTAVAKSTSPTAAQCAANQQHLMLGVWSNNDLLTYGSSDPFFDTNNVFLRTVTTPTVVYRGVYNWQSRSVSGMWFRAGLASGNSGSFTIEIPLDLEWETYELYEDESEDGNSFHLLLLL
jgi:hypothetical protein